MKIPHQTNEHKQTQKTNNKTTTNKSQNLMFLFAKHGLNKHVVNEKTKKMGCTKQYINLKKVFFFGAIFAFNSNNIAMITTHPIAIA